MATARRVALSWTELAKRVKKPAFSAVELAEGPANPISRTRLFGKPEADIRVTLFRDNHAWCPCVAPQTPQTHGRAGAYARARPAMLYPSIHGAHSLVLCTLFFSFIPVFLTPRTRCPRPGSAPGGQF